MKKHSSLYLIIYCIAVWFLCSGMLTFLNIMNAVVFRLSFSRFVITTVEMLVAYTIILVPIMIYNIMKNERMYGSLRKCHKEEGYSDHFFELAIENGCAIKKKKDRTGYWVDLMGIMMMNGRVEDAIEVFQLIDAEYIHLLERKSAPRNKNIVLLYYNNGLCACLEDGRMESAKALFTDGMVYLKAKEKSVAIKDTLCEYYYAMKRYRKAKEEYEDLLAYKFINEEMKKKVISRIEECDRYLNNIEETRQ